MVDVIGKAKVIVESDVDTSSVQKSGGKIGSALKTGALVGVAALGTLTVAGVKAFQSFEQAEAQSRKLTQVLDNMGKSDAAPAVEKLADEVSRLTGVDDDLIKQGQTLLGTFSEVAATAGETGGVFERATRAAVDLSATGFGSVESASVMLGKALQDPTKGITALRRAGVTFTEEQKKLIEGFVEANDVASAQAIILKEVEKQVGGTAEASATESQKIRRAFGELEESTGHLVDALIGEGKGKKGGLSGAIYNVSDALNETADSKAWGKLGEDIRSTGGDIGDLTSDFFALDKRIGTTILKLPNFGKGLRNLIDPTHGLAEVVLDLVDALKGLNKQLDGDAGLVLLNENNTDFGDSDFIKDITGNASGGRSLTSGWSWVGEEGPELIKVPSGSDIYSTGESSRMASGGDQNTYLQFYGPTSLSEARREADWARTYGTRFGSATSAGAL